MRPCAERTDEHQHGPGRAEPSNAAELCGLAVVQRRGLEAFGGFDLVVMGTHGRTGLRHFLIGSTAERVVRTSKVPVLTVPLPHEG